MFKNNSGYIGQKMSVRAKEAYEAGELRLAQIRKSDMLSCLERTFIEKSIKDENYKKKLLKKPLQAFKNIIALYYSTGWHHTGKYFNKTEFYEIPEALDERELDYIYEYVKEIKEKKIIKYAIADKNVWGGTKRYPKITGSETFYGELKNDWLYDETSKRRVNIRGNNITFLEIFESKKELLKYLAKKEDN